MSDPESKPLMASGAEGHANAEPSGRRILWKVGLRLLPFLVLLYLVNILDRINVGFARLQMLGDIGLEGPRADEIFGWGAGIFYLGYILFEIPSNLILRQLGARRWISRIMISWGLVSAAMMFVQGTWSFYTLRFLLGVAEAGFFPGIILYLSYWFPARERARAMALFMVASPLAGVVGNPASGAIMEYLDTGLGLAGWQWLFLIEGIPAVILGMAVWFYLTDRPEQARWLTPDERTWLAGRMRQEAKLREEHHGLTRLKAMAVPRVWLLIAIYFTVAVGTNCFGFFGPAIVNHHFEGRDKFTIGQLLALPNLAAVLGMVWFGVHSDRSGERRLHVASAALLSALGWGLTAMTSSPWLALFGLALAHLGGMSMLPTFWALPTSFLSGAAAAGGIALINSAGNIGGFLGPVVMGKLNESTGQLTPGLSAMAGMLFLGSLLALCVRHNPRLERSS
jgi:ACS family tartrate transporter-like MFS transporter